MPIKLDDSNKCFLKLLIGKCVAERVDGRIQITEPVTDVVQYSRHAHFVLRTETNDEGKDVPRSPTDQKSPQNNGDCAQGFPGAILTFALLFFSGSFFAFAAAAPAATMTDGLNDAAQRTFTVFSLEFATTAAQGG